MKKTTLPDFKNKVVSVSLTTDNFCYSISSPRWETQGGKLFLIGSVPHDGSARKWAEGALRAVAWDQVTDYMVFDSVKDFVKRQAKYSRKK